MRRKKVKKKTYLFYRMDEDKWEEFAAIVSRKMENSNWQNIVIIDEVSLNNNPITQGPSPMQQGYKRD
ncbi:7583_t:CDS:2 [Gigaspora rosea]|nr:7583_t:CDS:2 [Gigaspora rosea]